MIWGLIPGSDKRFTSSVLFSGQLWGPPFSGGSSLEVRWPGHEDRSPPFSATVVIDWSNISTASICIHDIYRDNFTFYHFYICLPLRHLVVIKLKLLRL